DFSPDSFLTHDSSKQGDGGRSICYDEIAWVNESKGVIVVPYNFPYDELYLLYNSTGGADSMTNIPVIAQAAIEAYISWKYAMNKRGGLTEGRIFKAEYIEQVELLRARLLE